MERELESSTGFRRASRVRHTGKEGLAFVKEGEVAAIPWTFAGLSGSKLVQSHQANSDIIWDTGQCVLLGRGSVNVLLQVLRRQTVGEACLCRNQLWLWQLQDAVQGCVGNPAGILMYMPGGEERNRKVDSRSGWGSGLSYLVSCLYCHCLNP